MSKTVYCTKTDVKAYSKIAYTDLGYANDTAFDTFLDGLILLAQSVIDDYCNLPNGFFDTGGLSFTNELHDYHYPWIDLRYYPVLSTSKVEYNDQGFGITPNWITIAVPDYILNAHTGQLMLVNKIPAISPLSVRVSYTAGYNTTPDVVEHVCIQLCCNLLHEILQRKINPQVQAEEMTFKLLVPAAFNPESRAILDPYRRKNVAVG